MAADEQPHAVWRRPEDAAPGYDDAGVGAPEYGGRPEHDGAGGGAAGYDGAQALPGHGARRAARVAGAGKPVIRDRQRRELPRARHAAHLPAEI